MGNISDFNEKTSGAEENTGRILAELSELEKLEAEQWDYLPKPPRKIRRKGDRLFLRAFLTLLIIFTALFLTAARFVFGKGWFKALIKGESNNKSFTLPIADVPELEDRFYQPDGRFTVEGVFEAVSPSIVTIDTYAESSALTSYCQGSGIIMSSDGYIVTNAHVVEGEDALIKVRLKDGTEYRATAVGSDPKSDLAVIKIDAKDLPAAQFGDSDAVVQGEQVVAIGSPAGLDSTVTTGIVSAVDRMIRVDRTNISMSCIQIDAAINPGNSGGALINMWGQVIGVTSSKLDALEYDSIGFAIEMSAAKPIIEQLVEQGKVIGRPKIGISFRSVSEMVAEFSGTPAGLEIASISPDCDIANTELRVGDYITEMQGKKVTSAEEVYDIILKMSPGDEVSAHVVRLLPDGGTEEFDIRFDLMEDYSDFIPVE